MSRGMKARRRTRLVGVMRRIVSRWCPGNSNSGPARCRPIMAEKCPYKMEASPCRSPVRASHNSTQFPMTCPACAQTLMPDARVTFGRAYGLPAEPAAQHHWKAAGQLERVPPKLRAQSRAAVFHPGHGVAPPQFRRQSINSRGTFRLFSRSVIHVPREGSIYP